MRWMTAIALRRIPDRLFLRQHAEPAEDGVHRRAKLVAERREELVLDPALTLRLVARAPLADEQPLALLLGAPLRADVAADADDLLDTVPSSRGSTRPRSVIQTDGAIGPHRPVFALVRPRRAPARVGRPRRRVAHPRGATSGKSAAPDRTSRAESRTASPGSVDHVTCPDSHVPLPCGDLRHVHRHPQPLFVLAHAAVRDGQRRGALGHAQLELLVDLLERFLRLLPLGDLGLQLLVELASARVFRYESTNTPTFERRMSRVDRLAQIVDGADAVAAQDVLVVDEMRGQEQDRHVLRPAPLLDQVRQLDAAHARHPDVEDHRGELVVQQRQQRFVRRLRAARSVQPLDASITSSASRLRGSSSTMQNLDVGVAHRALRSSAVQPYAQQRQQLLGVDRLRDVVGRAGLQALLAVALHRLGRQRQNRQRAELRRSSGSRAWFRSRPSPAS